MRVLWKGLLDGRWNGHGKGIRFYLDRNDLKNARRTVNITDKWKVIAGYHRAFQWAIEEAGGVPVAEPPKKPPHKPVERAPDPPRTKPPKNTEKPPRPASGGFFWWRNRHVQSR